MIPLDEKNAIDNNTMHRYRILPDLAEITPPIGRHVADVYGRELPRPLYAMGNGTTGARHHRVSLMTLPSSVGRRSRSAWKPQPRWGG